MCALQVARGVVRSALTDSLGRGVRPRLHPGKEVVMNVVELRRPNVKTIGRQ